jgi:hypothetical protein
MSAIVAVERGDDTTEHLDLDTVDLAEKPRVARDQ